MNNDLQRFGIHFNDDAVVILSRRNIPPYVKFIASLGKTFNYYKPLDYPSATDAFLSMDNILCYCDRFDELFYARHLFNDIKNLIHNDAPFPIDHGANPSEAQAYIYSLALLTTNFLKKNQNKNIIILSSDKGGKTIIMDKEDYIAKAYQHLNDNIDTGNYSLVYDCFHTVIRPNVETRYYEVAARISPFLMLDGSIKEPLKRESYLLPLFYGCPKIHKPGIPLRPIIASLNMIGEFISNWLLQKLGLIASLFDRYNVANVLQIIPDLRRFKLEDNHELCSFDYVSMFTNVDVTSTSDIVSMNYTVVSASTLVPLDVFLDCLNFFICDAAFFGFDGQIYKQIKGLAMGNRLAQILAEIKTNHALQNAVNEFCASSISIMYKFVDDIFSSIHRDRIHDVMNAISREVAMKITVTRENVDHEIEFLDCTFKRNPDNSISSRWFKKECSCLQIINFHSSHPWIMKRNIINQMIKKAITMTSPEFLSITMDLIANVLKRSSYPEPTIASFLRWNPNIAATMPPPRNPAVVPRYVSFPYSPPIFNMVKSVVDTVRLPVRLAPAPFANNRRIIFSSIKDKWPSTWKKNVLFQIKCSDCPFTHTSTAVLLDVQRTVDSLLKNPQSTIFQHFLSFPAHNMITPPEILKTFRNKFDARRSHNAIKEICKLHQRTKGK